MDNLSDKLKAMGVRVGARDVKPRVERYPYPVERIIPGEYQSTRFGDVYRIDSLYPPDHQYGAVGLKINHSLHAIAHWAQVDHVSEVDPARFVFLDTETTGLSGGTGTMAFLVGVGRFLEDGFHLTQYFVRSPQEEAAMLAALTEYLDPCAAMVTFNGKSFDAPLLNTRYTLQAFQSPLRELAHLDLLPLARRLWRDRLVSRALKSLEVEILGAARTQDEVPGYLIPEYYFEYLRSGDARPLAGVVYHNAMDIVALAALFNYTSAMLANPRAGLSIPGLDQVALGKLFEDMGDLDTAVAMYEQGLAAGLPEEFFWRTVERFALLHKKRREWLSCVNLWEKAAEHGDYYAYIELAKYYEHEERDPEQALAWCEAALEHIGAPGYPLYMRRLLLPELNRRVERLKRKLGV